MLLINATEPHKGRSGFRYSHTNLLPCWFCIFRGKCGLFQFCFPDFDTLTVTAFQAHDTFKTKTDKMKGHYAGIFFFCEAKSLPITLWFAWQPVCMAGVSGNRLGLCSPPSTLNLKTLYQHQPHTSILSPYWNHASINPWNPTFRAFTHLCWRVGGPRDNGP